MSKQVYLSKPVRRIVSLVPSHTEILYFLGLGALVVGVTEHCDYPAEAVGKEKVGTFGQPDLSKILSLRPDLVWVQGLMHQLISQELRDKGIAVYAPNPRNVEEVLRSMEDIALMCGLENSPNHAVVSLRERVNGLEEKSRQRSGPRVFRLMNDHPVITPGPGSFQYDALRLTGAQLMGFDSCEAYLTVPWEAIVEYDPEIILFCGTDKGQKPRPRCKGCAAKNPMCQRSVEDIITEKWSGISAVRQGRIYPLTCDIICRPGPRLIDGMEKLQNYFLHVKT